jgi:hypothetical protein
MHWRLNREINAPESELKIELTNPHLGRELTNDWAQIESFWNAIHLLPFKMSHGRLGPLLAAG